MTLDNRINQFLDSYWKQPIIFKDEETEEVEEYYEKLRQKYGEKVWTEYERLLNKFVMSLDNKESIALADYVFKTGMCEDVAPDTTLRGRETLRMLLTYLSKKDKPFTMADLGSGCGKLTAGLAGFLDNITTLYANEISQNGLKQLYNHIEELPPDKREKALKKIIPVQGDYGSEQVQKKISGVDIAHSAYPQYGIDCMIPLLGNIARSEILLCYPFDMSNVMDPLASYAHDEIETMHIESYNEIGRPHGLKFKILGMKHYIPIDMIVISRGMKNA